MIKEKDRETIENLVINQCLTRLAQLEKCGGGLQDTNTHEVWACMPPNRVMEYVLKSEIEDILKKHFDSRYVSGTIHFFLRTK